MAGEGAGAGSRGLAGLVLALGVVALAGCAVGAKAGEPALPAGFAALDMPDVDANAFVYLNAGQPARVPLGAFGATDLVAGAGVVSIEVVVNDPDSDFAARAEFVDGATARRVAEAARSVASADAARWVQADGPFVAVGRSDAAGGNLVRAALAAGSPLIFPRRSYALSAALGSSLLATSPARTAYAG